MSTLTNLSFAYPHVGASDRAILFRSGLTRQHETADNGEVFVLSTCLRVEIAYRGTPEMAGDQLDALFPQSRPSISPVVRTDAEAFHHLCRVAAGLESPLLGEDEVLGQFRGAVGAVRNNGNGLDRMLEKAIGIGRSARRQITNRVSDSLASVAVEMAMPAGRIAVLGAGSMARATVDAIGDSAEVDVYARRPGVVAGHTALPWEDVAAAFAGADVVVSTVPGEHTLIEPAALDSVLSGRREPLRLFDLGMPPGFAPLTGVDYTGIDGIASNVPRSSVPEADVSVMEDAIAYWRKLTTPHDAGSLINAIIDQADAVAEEVSRRFAARIDQAEDPAAILEQAVRRVARGVLHRPIAFIGQADPNSIETLSQAFGSD